MLEVADPKDFSSVKRVPVLLGLLHMGGSYTETRIVILALAVAELRTWKRSLTDFC